MPLYWFSSIFMMIFIVISLVGFYMIYSNIFMKESLLVDFVVNNSWVW